MNAKDTLLAAIATHLAKADLTEIARLHDALVLDRPGEQVAPSDLTARKPSGPAKRKISPPSKPTPHILASVARLRRFASGATPFALAKSTSPRLKASQQIMAGARMTATLNNAVRLGLAKRVGENYVAKKA